VATAGLVVAMNSSSAAGRMEDAHVLMATLRRQALIRCHHAANGISNGLDMAAKALALSPKWGRRLGTWECCLGLIEKISVEGIDKHLALLDAKITRAMAIKETGHATASHREEKHDMQSVPGDASNTPGHRRVLRMQTSTASLAETEARSEDLQEPNLKEKEMTPAIVMAAIERSFERLDAATIAAAAADQKTQDAIRAASLGCGCSRLDDRMDLVSAMLDTDTEAYDEDEQEDGKHEEQERALEAVAALENGEIDVFLAMLPENQQPQ